MGCLCCGAEPVIGALCRSCAQQVEPCDGLIPDHIHSKIDTTEAEAWMVDGFGGAHAISIKGRIGRNHGSELIVLASSVSREHAELEKTDAGWIVRDLGSRNGTFVNGVRGQGPVALHGRAVVKVGDVALWFLPEVVHEPSVRPTMTTDGTRGGLLRFHLGAGELELCVVVSGDEHAAGALLWRAAGTEGSWSERALAPLEFQLLRALCIRAHEESGSPSAIRGCVPTKQLVNELPFQSKYANQENVRQVVMRLRGALAEVGAKGVLAVAPGRGYYLACPVTVASIS
jgi:FHA domain-containing protein